MELTPEERRRIYEEEKTRLEEEQRARRESRQEGGGTTGLEPGVAGLLCYLGMWVTGIIFLVLEQKNKFVRFHAAQSVVVFGTLGILSAVLRFMPYAGQFFSAAFGVLIFILWLVLMVKAYRGEYYRLPVAAEVAEWLLNAISSSGVNSTSAPVRSASQSGVEQVVTLKESPKVLTTRTGEIVGSAFAIAFNVAAFIFFNFYHQYFAYYNQTGGVWVRQPLLTAAYSAWLPVLNVAIVLTIIGHVILIVTDRRVVRETVMVMLDIFALITIGSLLSIFPFNFRALPVSPELIAWSVKASLSIVMVVIAISVIVRFVKLILRIVRGSGF